MPACRLQDPSNVALPLPPSGCRLKFQRAQQEFFSCARALLLFQRDKNGVTGCNKLHVRLRVMYQNTNINN